MRVVFEGGFYSRAGCIGGFMVIKAKYDLPNTNRIQASIQISIAVKPSAFGELVVMLLKILIKTRNSVINNAIRPASIEKV